MYQAKMQAEIRSDYGGRIKINKMDFMQQNENIQIKIDENGNKKKINLSDDDIGDMLNNIKIKPVSNIENRLKILGDIVLGASTDKTRSRKTRSRKTRSRKTRSRKTRSRKTRSDKGKHHKHKSNHKKRTKRRSVKSRTATPYPKKR